MLAMRRTNAAGAVVGSATKAGESREQRAGAPKAERGYRIWKINDRPDVGVEAIRENLKGATSSRMPIPAHSHRLTPETTNR
jgi:hypothetical protein